MIVGTGCLTIQQLIDKENSNPKRGVHHENVLTQIKIDDETLAILAEKNWQLDSILPKNEILYLKGTANLSAGATASDVTDKVHPDNVRLAERVARLINLDICGIDIIAEDVSKPINAKNGAVIEVNAGPGFRMHLHPTQGTPRNVAASVLDMLYPTNKFSIPIVAVTGTNGKTTVVRLVAHLARKANYNVGYTTTEGIYYNGHLNFAGDCSGPASATAVLTDPNVDFAVLECARGGILRSGLAFSQCDISIITNISSDHLGLHGINTLEELTQVKGVVAHSTKDSGYAILNAEDDRVYALKDELNCHVALFAMAENERIKEHCAQGGLASYVENGYIVVHSARDKNYLAKLSELPVTFNGAATCMIQNILPAVLAGLISGFALENIAHHLMELRLLLKIFQVE